MFQYSLLNQINAIHLDQSAQSIQRFAEIFYQKIPHAQKFEWAIANLRLIKIFCKISLSEQI